MNEKMFFENEKLIWFTINKYLKLSSFDRDELYQEGCVTLLKVISNYDESKGNFSTYAVRAIRNDLLRYIANSILPIKGGSSNSFASKIRLFILKNKNLSKQETFCELEKLGLVSRDFKSTAINLESFDAIWGVFHSSELYDEENNLKIDVADDTNICNEVEDIVLSKRIIDKVNIVLDGETEKRKNIYKDWLEMIVGGETVTYSVLGEKYNMSRQAIYQNIQKVNKKVISLS